MDIACRSETICAIATPIGIGGIGILKISGPDALPILQKIFRPSRRPTATFVPESHRLYYGWIQNPRSGELLDEVLVSYMAGPRSYTGEDVVEINCHSGYAVLNAMMDLVLEQGARLAEPGEFTQRAFLSGRMDLSQAEAVADLIHSRSEKALRQATRHLKGTFGRQVARWREELLDLEARVEAHLDFSDDLEEDEDSFQVIRIRLEEELLPGFREILAHYEEGRILREGLSMVLVGKPNVGKSSILNALVGRERAIVTPVEGTTRDVVEDSFFVSGIQVRVLDTAGIRKKPDAIESLGIEHTLRCVDEADLVVWIVDRSRPLSEDDDRIGEKIHGKPVLLVINKADCEAVFSRSDVETRYPWVSEIVEICALRPRDVDALKRVLEEKILKRVILSAETTFAVNWRQKECIERAWEALNRILGLPDPEGSPELVSEELRAARREMEAILGLNVDDALLDRIFSRFCVGK